MTIQNFTPHSINIFDANSVEFMPNVRKYIANDTATPIAVIPSSGMLSAKISTVADGDIDGVPVFAKKVTGCDPLPDGDGVVVVSALYATAARQMGFDMSRIFTVADPVYSGNDGTKIVGCLGICPTI